MNFHATKETEINTSLDFFHISHKDGCIIILRNFSQHWQRSLWVKVIHTLIMALSISGCSYLNNMLTADPAPDSGFLEHPEQMKPQAERFPFNRVWCKDHGCDWSKYRSVMIAEIDTSHVIKMGWWDNFNMEPRAQLQEDQHLIANYMKNSFTSALKNDQLVHHDVVDNPQNDTMILELALVELVPTKAFMRSVMDVVGLLIPGAQVLGLTGSGSVAIEGRIRDARTGEVIFKFADRQQDKTAVISVEDFTWHGHAREIIDDWAKEFAELYDTPSSHMVAASSHFTLKPW